MKFASALFAFVVLVGAVSGQIEGITLPIGYSVTQTATIQLGLPGPIPIVPLQVRPPTTLVVGTRLQITAHAPNAPHGSVQWFKNNALLAETGATLEIASVSTSDSGAYHAVVKDSEGRPSSSETARVMVIPEGQRVINVSTRARIDAGQPFFVTGLVVEPGAASGALLLVRAVGPGLAEFGLPDFLAAPRLVLSDQNGRTIEPVAPPIIPGIPSPHMSVAEATKRVGAFPLPAGSADVAQLFYLSGGAYTAHVSSADNGNGAVLLEIYEVPF